MDWIGASLRNDECCLQGAVPTFLVCRAHAHTRELTRGQLAKERPDGDRRARMCPSLGADVKAAVSELLTFSGALGQSFVAECATRKRR